MIGPFTLKEEILSLATTDRVGVEHRAHALLF